MGWSATLRPKVFSSTSTRMMTSSSSTEMPVYMSESQMRLTLTCSRQWVRVLRLAPRAAMTIWTTLRTPVMLNQMSGPNQARNHQLWVYWKEQNAGMKPSSTLRQLLKVLLR